MKTIPLTQGKVALVDDEDYEALAAHKWHAIERHGGRFYAARNMPRGQRRGLILMHAVIAGTPAGMVTDHINGDGLNNQRSNLRVCTVAENLANRGRPKNNTSGFKGLIRHPRKKRNQWQASIRIAGKSTHLGYFSTAEAAARAYDKAAFAHYGEFAFLNFPPK